MPAKRLLSRRPWPRNLKRAQYLLARRSATIDRINMNALSIQFLRSTSCRRRTIWRRTACTCLLAWLAVAPLVACNEAGCPEGYTLKGECCRKLESLVVNDAAVADAAGAHESMGGSSSAISATMAGVVASDAQLNISHFFDRVRAR